MTVTITQDIRDIGNVPDNVTVRFGSPVAREVGSSLITTKWTSFTAVGGILTAVVEPGPAKVMIRHVGTFDITIPNTDSDLWSLIEAAVALPPTTSADQLAQAIGAYLAAHPAATDEYHEYANLAAFPGTGVTDRIYVAVDTGFLYRWTGSVYVQIGGGATTGVVPNALRSPAFGSPITNRAAGRSLSSTSSNLTETTRVKHVVTEDCLDVSLIFFGWYNHEQTPAVNATIKADIEINSVIHPVAFQGSRTATLMPGFALRADPLGLRLVKGDAIYVRTNRVIASGSYGQNVTLRQTLGEGFTATDTADSGTVTTVSDDTTTSGFTAAAVVSSGVTAGRSLAIIGDSIANGFGETTQENGGYIMRTLPDSVGVIRLNGSGGKASDFVANTIATQGGRRRIAFATCAKYAWTTYGINDINQGSSAATLQADLLKLWNTLTAAGLKVYASTMVPGLGTSTDAWVTTTNQTVWASNSIRAAVNDWIRTKPAPLAGFFDPAAATETALNSGIWRVDHGVLTDDGIHPNATGYSYIATQLSAAVAAAFV